MPSDVILEGLYMSELQDFVQLQTVLALYDQETVGNNGQTCYLRLKTSVKLHFDQMMENSKLQSPERSSGKRDSHQVKNATNATLRGKWGECFQWRAHGHCSKRYSCSFSHDTTASGSKSTTCFAMQRPFVSLDSLARHAHTQLDDAPRDS